MDYYEVDSRKYTFAEYWRLVPWAVPLTWTMKVLGRRIDFSQATPYPTRIDRLDPADVLAEHRKGLRLPIDDCERLGLRFRFFYTEPLVSVSTEGTAAALLSDDGHSMAVLIFSKYVPSGLTERHMTLVTRLHGAEPVETTTAKKRFDDPPGADIARFPGETPEALLARHRARVRERGGAIQTIAEDELEDVLAAESDAATRHRIERGVLVPCPPEKVERLRAQTSGDRPPDSRWFSASTLRSLLLWIVIWIVVIVLWNHFATY